MMNAVEKKEIRTRWVVLITLVTMTLEIGFGIKTNSMALLADGIHMGSHAIAIGLSWISYIAIRKLKAKDYKGDCDKILSLSGYSNGLILLLFAGVLLVQTIQRFFNPSVIEYKEAIGIATIGLIVNLGCAVLLHSNIQESDFNFRSAYIHVLSDALTSITAIMGIAGAMFLSIPWLDSLGAVICSFVIVKWSVSLLKDSGKSLLNIEF